MYTYVSSNALTLHAYPFAWYCGPQSFHHYSHFNLAFVKLFVLLRFWFVLKCFCGISSMGNTFKPASNTTGSLKAVHLGSFQQICNHSLPNATRCIQNPFFKLDKRFSHMANMFWSVFRCIDSCNTSKMSDLMSFGGKNDTSATLEEVTLWFARKNEGIVPDSGLA